MIDRTFNIIEIFMGKFREIRTSAIIFAGIMVFVSLPLIGILAALLTHPSIREPLAEDTAILIAVVMAIISLLTVLQFVGQCDQHVDGRQRGWRPWRSDATR